MRSLFPSRSWIDLAGAALGFAVALVFPFATLRAAESKPRPNIVLLMADDQGWGETGYNGHPYLKTPALDQMAATGLRLDRFYAAASVCSPTRTSVLTGRSPIRSGVFAPNYSTRPEEITIAQVLQAAGYRTGHFGKWHVGAVKATSPLNPARLGFDEYLSHDNFFEMDPPLSRNGAAPEIIKGEGSQVIVAAAMDFIRKVKRAGQPFFVVLWFGSPHSPYSGLAEDVARYENVPGETLRRRFAEITAMDRAIGNFRATLQELELAEHTLVWFNSDNGITTEGIPAAEQKHLFNGGWRDHKGGIYEGSFRVPGLITWPAVIQHPRTSTVACVTSDIFPTLLDLLDLPAPDPRRPLDGVSLKNLIVNQTMTERPRPIGFWRYGNADGKNARYLDAETSRGTTPTTRNPAIQFQNFQHPVARTNNFGGVAAWTDNRYKLVVSHRPKGAGTELYDLLADPREQHDLAARLPDVVRRMTAELEDWQRSVERSLAGADYPK